MENELALREPTESESLRMIHALSHGARPEAIAAALRVDLGLLNAWLERWQSPAVSENPMRAAAVARRAEAVKKWQSKIATESAALSADAFGLARNKVEEGDARGFNDAAKGISTLVQLTRQAEGLDSVAAGQGAASLSVYVLRVGENGVEETRPLRNVTPEADPEF